MTESPQVFAKRIGIAKRGKSGSSSNTALSWDDCLLLAVIAYWENRPTEPEAAA